jgi:hypothetical protein
MPMARVDGKSMTAEIKRHVAPGSVLMTDETNIYHGPKVPSGKRTIAGMTRHTVNHGSGEPVRSDGTYRPPHRYTGSGGGRSMR